MKIIFCIIAAYVAVAYVDNNAQAHMHFQNLGDRHINHTHGIHKQMIINNQHNHSNHNHTQQMQQNDQMQQQQIHNQQMNDPIYQEIQRSIGQGR